MHLNQGVNLHLFLGVNCPVSSAVFILPAGEEKRVFCPFGLCLPRVFIGLAPFSNKNFRLGLWPIPRPAKIFSWFSPSKADAFDTVNNKPKRSIEHETFH